MNQIELHNFLVIHYKSHTIQPDRCYIPIPCRVPLTEILSVSFFGRTHLGAKKQITRTLASAESVHICFMHLCSDGHVLSLSLQTALMVLIFSRITVTRVPVKTSYCCSHSSVSLVQSGHKHAKIYFILSILKRQKRKLTFC